MSSEGAGTGYTRDTAERNAAALARSRNQYAAAMEAACILDVIAGIAPETSREEASFWRSRQRRAAD
ncbi:hypothetical protein [Alloyangia pacifica]|uniref:hypothetical protein n=1 Tax=Alloyangia pacifica TaxID=311180 RepID=UPI00131EDAD4|nr:hypothetical protein [Alloyangia pacifica]